MLFTTLRIYGREASSRLLDMDSWTVTRHIFICKCEKLIKKRYLKKFVMKFTWKKEERKTSIFMDPRNNWNEN